MSAITHLPEQVVKEIEEPNDKDVLFSFLGLFVFLAVVEGRSFERIADRAIPFEGDHRDVGRRAVDREKGEVDVHPAGELAENEFIWRSGLKWEKNLKV